jgi:nitrogen fixation/metabolism regulation signal transduction histidine kinase
VDRPELKNGSDSLERYILYWLAAGGALLLSLIVTITVLAQASTAFILLFSLLLIILYIILAQRFYQRLLTSFYRLANNVEAIRVDDFSLFSRSPFSAGGSAQVFSELRQLGEELRLKKRNFDETTLLVYSLIEELESPVLILDQHQRLIHANPAFSLWCGREWRLIRLTHVERLGLIEYPSGKWQFQGEQSETSGFQVRASRFTAKGGEHQLLLMTDISRELRSIQQKSWQQLIRVLGHEVNNSLTPIKSLAQSLLAQCEGQQLRLIEVILERSEGLETFIKNYARLYRHYSLNLQPIDLVQLFANLSPLFPTLTINTNLQVGEMIADPDLFKQVVINIINNAQDAMTPEKGETAEFEKKHTIEVETWQNRGHLVLSIADVGCGIQNPDNLFVPFYTTKVKGQGIGLSFSRHIIEQHGGAFTLKNRKGCRGAVAIVTLPITS